MRSPIILFLALVLINWEPMHAQQLPLFSQYRENQSILNPAALNIDYIRNDYNFSAGASYRNQWGETKLELDNGETMNFGPNTITARVEWIFPEDRFFVGGYLMKDESGAINLLGAYARAGYFIIDPETSSIGLAAAISGGYNQFRLDFISPGIYDYSVQYTTIILDEEFKQSYWDVSLGVFAWGEVYSGFFEGDIIYGGISIPQVFGLPLSELGATQEDNTANPENYVQISVVGGIYKYLGEETFLEGSINFNKLLKDKAPFSLTANLRWHWRDWLWLGAGARFPFSQRTDASGTSFSDLLGDRYSSSEYSISSLLFDVGFNLGKNLSYALDTRNIKLGFGYEVPLGGLLRKLGNTIEINLTYTMDTRGGRR